MEQCKLDLFFSSQILIIYIYIYIYIYIVSFSNEKCYKHTFPLFSMNTNISLVLKKQINTHVLYSNLAYIHTFPVKSFINIYIYIYIYICIL